MKKYSKVWWLLALQAAKTAFESRFGAVLFVIGKMVRFLLFLFFILLIASRVEKMVGYSLWQMVLFFATFNLIDTITQLFFREVYRFRSHIVAGDFDHILTKPLSPLFRSLFGGTDVLDIPILFLSILFIVFAAFHLENISFIHAGAFLLLLLNAFLIATAFHIFVLSLGILTTETDNTLWLYRDLTQMGRVPVDIYQEPLRGFITFVIPVGIMMTFPAKVLMGLLAPQGVFLSFFLGGLLFYLAFSFWQFSLKRYTSASS